MSTTLDSVSVVIAEDHALVRRTLRTFLESQPDIEVLGECGDAEAALSTVLAMRPAVLLLDIDMPGMGSFAAAQAIAQSSSQTRVIILSAFATDRYIDDALAAGVWGYVSKREPPELLLQAIRQVIEGVPYFSPGVQSRIVIDEHGTRLAHRGQSRLSQLSAREMEVLRYLAVGLSKKEIALALNLSIKTVERHTANIMNKLEIHDRVELARFSIREGLTQP